MNPVGYGFFALLLGSAVALVGTSQPAIRRWILRSYALLLTLIAFFLYLVAPRTALSVFQGSGATWSKDAVAGMQAMYSVAQAVGGALLIIAIALVILAIRFSRHINRGA